MNNVKFKTYTDEELIRMLRSGQGDIADYIMEKYKPLVRKKTNAMYLIGGENEDLIQEGMIGLFKAVRDYQEDKGASFFSFAELCISRQLYSALESSNRKKHQPLNTYVSFSGEDDSDSLRINQMATEKSISPEQMMIEQEAKEEFFARLEENLSAMEKTVLYLYLEGNSYTQIADIMSKSPKSIDNCLQRIRSKMKHLNADRR